MGVNSHVVAVYFDVSVNRRRLRLGSMLRNAVKLVFAFVGKIVFGKSLAGNLIDLLIKSGLGSG